MISWKRASWMTAVVVAAAIPSFAWWHWPTRLPHPDQCSRRQLYAWVALRNLQQEPLEVQRALVRRFQELLSASSDTEPIDVDPKYQQTVSANRQLLQDRWFFDCVDEYYAMPPTERAAFIDQKLQIALNWQSMTRQDQGTADPNRPSAIGQAAAAWIEKSKAENRHETIGVLAATTLRWLSTSDLSVFSSSSQERIASEILAQLEEGDRSHAIPASREEMSFILPPNTELLKQNAQLLLRAWFRKQARTYQAHDGPARAAFVRDQVQAVRASPFIPLVFQSGGETSAPNPLVLLIKVQQTINRWIREADDEDKPMLRSFSAAVYGELFRSGIAPTDR